LWEIRGIISFDGGQVHDEAAAIIRQIRGPLAVAAVAGLYRTGKSYLLNVLTDTIGQGKKESFDWQLLGKWLCLT
jgi:hypothetical protein